MFKRKFLPVAVVTLVMLVVVAIPIFAASGNSWTDHFTIFHWGNSRTSHGATGEFKLDVTTQLKLDGDYMCGGPSSTHKACPGSHTATCLKVTADSGDWWAYGTHKVYTWPGLVFVWEGESSGQ